MSSESEWVLVDYLKKNMFYFRYSAISSMSSETQLLTYMFFTVTIGVHNY